VEKNRASDGAGRFSGAGPVAKRGVNFDRQGRLEARSCQFLVSRHAGVGRHWEKCRSLLDNSLAVSASVLGVNCSEIGTELTVFWGERGEPQKEIRALVTAAPYTKDNRRIDTRNF
jgi:hypothetical protein